MCRSLCRPFFSAQVLVKGGEGIMLRQPKSLYENCRSHTLLKVKFFHSEEAKVTRHEKGSGRCQDMCGKIHCVLPNGVEFKIGECRAALPVHVP